MRHLQKELKTLQRAILGLYDNRARKSPQDGALRIGSKSGIAGRTARSRKKDLTELDQLVLELLREHFSPAARTVKATHAPVLAQARARLFYGLTGRETEIAEWVAAGKTNPEIAMILRISARTVEKHMERVLGKLGVENRTAAALIIHDGHRKEAQRIAKDRVEADNLLVQPLQHR